MINHAMWAITLAITLCSTHKFNESLTNAIEAYRSPKNDCKDTKKKLSVFFNKNW